MNRQARRWLIVFGIWTIPVVFLLLVEEHNRRIPLLIAVILAAIPWYYWALLTLPVIRWGVYGRVPRTAGGIGLHALKGFALGALCGVIASTAHIVLDPVGETVRRSPLHFLLYGVFFWGCFGMMIYALLTAVGLVVGTQRRLRDNEVSAAQMQAQLAAAQLNALRAQLEPHFLFNTLNTIAMYIRDGDTATSIGLLTRLSDLLRRVLDSSGQQVTLATEIDHTKRYLEIEAVRFKDRLSLEFDIARDCEAALVPNLLLQPLVENAVRHGLTRSASAAHIGVTARRSDGLLRITVYNDGPALDAAWESASGIGVRNTMLRLKHLYGDEAKLTLSNAEQGVSCEVVLPFQT